MGKKSSAPAPAPDPIIAQSAVNNSELGKDWLAFNKTQYDEGKLRQVKEDELVGRVTDSALASQDKAEAWAGEDRQIQSDYRDKYDGWAEEDRALGRATMGTLDRMGAEAEANGKAYEAQFGAIAARENGFGAEEQDRYKTKFRPVQDRLVSDAMGWDSAERMDSEAAKAKADVVGNAAQQQEAARRQMASMGVNPNSGRFAAVDQANSTATALAAAGAQNTSRDVVRAQGMQMRGQAAQMGQQVLANGQQATQSGMQAAGAAQMARTTGIGTAMQAKNMGLAAAGVGNTTASMGSGQQGGGYAGLGLGLNAGSSAVGANGAANANFYQNGNVMQQGFSGAIGANNSAAGTMNSLYGNQLQGYSAQQGANGAASSGIGSLIGTLGGAAIGAF